MRGIFFRCLPRLERAQGNVSNFDDTFADHFTGASDPDIGDHSGFFRGTRVEYAGAIHLNALRDAPVKIAVNSRLIMAQQGRQRAVGAASCGVFGYAIKGCKHPRVDVKFAR